MLEGSDGDVRWNERIPDPDNPTQPRQIDVTIRRGCLITHVECRHHEVAQDVNWIEELMGRRLSLGADAIVAVSSSGFTEGALAKARRHGIVTRDLERLTETEIVAWGRTIELELSYYQYSNLTLVVAVAAEAKPFRRRHGSLRRA